MEFFSENRMFSADSLSFLSNEDLYWFMKTPGEWYCDACFSGNVPIPREDGFEQSK